MLEKKYGNICKHWYNTVKRKELTSCLSGVSIWHQHQIVFWSYLYHSKGYTVIFHCKSSSQSLWFHETKCLAQLRNHLGILDLMTFQSTCVSLCRMWWVHLPSATYASHTPMHTRQVWKGHPRSKLTMMVLNKKWWGIAWTPQCTSIVASQNFLHYCFFS